MPQIASYESVKAGRMRKYPEGTHYLDWRTEFMMPPPGAQVAPTAFLVESTPNRQLRTHYHNVDQFQVIVRGGGVLGKHALAVHGVHFARAQTPYGPIVNSGEGLAFLTLRSRRDTGAKFLPESSELLKSVPNRKPWQATELPTFGEADAVSVHPFSQIRDERGLAAHALKLKPNAETSAPDPSTSDGQYLIITKGSLVYQGIEHKALTIIFAKPDEQAFQLVAGRDGLEALALNFPRHTDITQPQTLPKAADKPVGLRVWQCQLCAFVYDEAKGMPEDGVPPGTRWEDVPDTWTCSDCGASKADFQMAVVE